MSESETESNEEQAMQRVDLFFTPAAVTNERLKGYTAIVIDVLRAATSIITALSNGAKDVIPAESISAAIDLASELQRKDILLSGERDGKLVEGFDLGNSPADYSRERVRGRTLIFGSTNGGPAVMRASVAKSLFLCSFINLNTVVDEVLKIPDPYPLAILCAGKYDSFAIEDAVCGGLLIKRLRSRLSFPIQLNDAGQAAVLLHSEFGGDILSLLRKCDHGEFLIEIGMENDLSLCAADSVLPLAPTLIDGKLVIPKGS